MNISPDLHGFDSRQGRLDEIEEAQPVYQLSAAMMDRLHPVFRNRFRTWRENHQSGRER